MTIIRHSDLRALGYCNRGSRALCARLGFNWQSFMQHGIDDSQLVGIDDDMVAKAREYAKQREQREGAK